MVCKTIKHRWGEAQVEKEELELQEREDQLKEIKS